jgi:threonyl-tRNA synthetase
MNCPMHNLIYGSRQRSYRELPLRLFELGTVYRYEKSGTLHGLMRIRGFTQDDSHIYCTPEQAHDEIRSLLGFVLSVLRAFGFDDFEANLSTRTPEKSVGTDEGWDAAIEALRAALEAEGLEYEVDEGGGAFYGPKIDVKVKDAIGRTGSSPPSSTTST